MWMLIVERPLKTFFKSNDSNDARRTSAKKKSVSSPEIVEIFLHIRENWHQLTMKEREKDDKM